MASLSNASETSLLELIFTNVAWDDLGDASGLQPSGAAGSLYIGLHTADPGEAGTQATSEAAYSGYARVAVARSAAGFTVAADNVSNAAAVTFTVSADGPETLTHFSIGLESSGATEILVSAALTANLIVNIGITPAFAIGELDTTAA